MFCAGDANWNRLMSAAVPAVRRPGAPAFQSLPARRSSIRRPDLVDVPGYCSFLTTSLLSRPAPPAGRGTPRSRGPAAIAPSSALRTGLEPVGRPRLGSKPAKAETRLRRGSVRSTRAQARQGIAPEREPEKPSKGHCPISAREPMRTGSGASDARLRHMRAPLRSTSAVTARPEGMAPRMRPGFLG